MKNRLLFFLLAVAVACYIISPLPISAHSGGTDSKGGHYNHSTGSYHYHHGYPAHQHEDGVCPYGGKYPGADKVEIQDSSLLWISLTVIIAFVVSFRHLRTKRNYPVLSAAFLSLPFAAIQIFIFPFKLIAAMVESFQDSREERRQKEAERIRAEQKRLEEKRRYTEMYGGRPLSLLVPIPEDSEIGSDGFPRISGTSSTSFWGDKYTYYISKNGYKYHNKTCRFVTSSSIPKNAYYLKVWRYSRCEICKPVLPDLSWVDEYKKIEKIKSDYQIDK